MNILRANPQLQKLDISSVEELTLNKLLNLINGNLSLSKLAEVNRFVSKHAMTEVLVLANHRLTVDDVIILSSQLNSLKRFEFGVGDQRECDRLMSQLKGDWKTMLSIWFDPTLIKLKRYRCLTGIS